MKRKRKKKMIQLLKKVPSSLILVSRKQVSLSAWYVVLLVVLHHGYGTLFL